MEDKLDKKRGTAGKTNFPGGILRASHSRSGAEEPSRMRRRRDEEKKSRASISNIAGLLLGRSPPKVENLHLGLVIIWGTTLDAIGIVLV